MNLLTHFVPTKKHNSNKGAKATKGYKWELIFKKRFLTKSKAMSYEYLLKKNCQNFIQFKATRGHPLSEEEHATNKLRSRIRVRCEHVFGRMSQMAMDQLRTIGLVRAKQHNALCNLVYNMDRYAFLRR